MWIFIQEGINTIIFIQLLHWSGFVGIVFFHILHYSWKCPSWKQSDEYHYENFLALLSSSFTPWAENRATPSFHDVKRGRVIYHFESLSLQIIPSFKLLFVNMTACQNLWFHYFSQAIILTEIVVATSNSVIIWSKIT